MSDDYSEEGVTALMASLPLPAGARRWATAAPAESGLRIWRRTPQALASAVVLAVTSVVLSWALIAHSLGHPATPPHPSSPQASVVGTAGATASTSAHPSGLTPGASGLPTAGSSQPPSGTPGPTSSGGPTPSGLAYDFETHFDKASAAGATLAATVTTTHANELLVAYVSVDGQDAVAQSVTVASSGGLNWHRVHVDADFWRWGDAAVWWSIAPGPLGSATVTATMSASGYTGAIVVAGYTGEDLTTPIGATAYLEVGRATNQSQCSLTTTHANSWLWSVGEDWNSSSPRSLPANQTMIHEFPDTTFGEDYWLQHAAATTASAGTPVQMNNCIPTTMQFGIVVMVELRSA